MYNEQINATNVKGIISVFGDKYRSGKFYLSYFPDNGTIFLMVMSLGISIFPKLKRIYVLRTNIIHVHYIFLIIQKSMK